MSWFNKTKSYLGVDVGAGGVKLVELREEKKRPVLFTYGFTSEKQDVHSLAKGEKTVKDLMAGNGEAKAAAGKMSEVVIEDEKANHYAEVIRLICKQARTVSKTAVVSLPVSSVFHAVVNLPLVKKEELEHILKAEVKKLLPYPLEETALDYQVMPPADGAKAQRVLVNAVPRYLVVFYSKIFQKAGLKLEALEPESVALSRSLVGRDKAVAMVVDAGAERTNFFIIDQTYAVTHNSIELGGSRINKVLQNFLGVEEAQVDQIKRDLFSRLSQGSAGGEYGLTRSGFLEMMMPVIDPVVKEIEYSFDIYLRQSGNEGKRPEKIILTGGASMFPYLPEYISDKFKIKCYVGDPWGRVVFQDGLKGVLRQIGPRMSVAIGLALRNLV